MTTPEGTDIAYELVPAAGGGPTFVFSHATGFCGAVWRPVVARVGESVPGAGLLVVDQRAHGASGSSTHPFDWWDLGRDLLAVIEDAAARSPVIGVGHSLGGAGLLLAELLEPGTFSAIVAVEPIVPPPPFERGPEPLAESALRRRRWFPSRQDAHDRWVDRFPFSEWDPAAFDGYLECGLVPGADPDTGLDGVLLACDPEDEAEWFRAAPEHGGWDRLADVSCPVVVVAGSRSAAHANGPPGPIAERLGQGALRMIEGADHFIPMEHPDVVAAIATELSRDVSRG